MPSYDRPKLVRLIEQRRAAHLVIADQSERWRAARDSRMRFERIIRDGSRSSRPNDAFIEQLLSLPLHEAFALTAEEVQGFDRQSGMTREKRDTGVNFGNFRNYLEYREREERLRAELETARTQFDERYSIVPQLCDAVRTWGFPDPKNEV